ncbi:MAG: hypothetical protein IH948_07745, partial [Bacteroidetes bacterium]|nr:hypothetical protein [Bacteroidota bacterium]
KKTESTNKDALNGDKITITGLYKELNEIYLDLHGVFHGKCVYCESLIDADQPGDLDHYRPKGRVTDSSNKDIIITESDGSTKPHPGYYWLAYDWLNLLPSCTDCNRPSKRKTVERIGKWNQFPVQNFRAKSPGEEVDEIPLIINPVLEDPTEHLDIDSTGFLIPLTDKGKQSVNIFGLNKRESLIEGRKRAYQEAQDKLSMLMMIMGRSSPEEAKRLDDLEDISMGKRPYAFASIKGLNDKAPEYSDILSRLNLT